MKKLSTAVALAAFLGATSLSMPAEAFSLGSMVGKASKTFGKLKNKAMGMGMGMLGGGMGMGSMMGGGSMGGGYPQQYGSGYGGGMGGYPQQQYGGGYGGGY